MSKVSPLFLVLLLVSTAGMYGCTHQKNGAATTKLRDIETRFAKLEEDFRTVSATAESNRKKLAQAESQRAELSKELEGTTQERDELRKEREDLRKQLVVRTAERDNLQSQLGQFRQELQGLIARVDTALAAPATPGGAVPAVPASRKTEKPE